MEQDADVRRPSAVREWTTRRVHRYQFPGVVVAWLFLYLSLTPSLLPRSAAVQGALSGITSALGYGVGGALAAVWHYLELPAPSARAGRAIKVVAGAVMVPVLLYFLYHLTRWQDDLRRLFGMDGVNDRTYPVIVLVVAFAVALLAIGSARLLRRAVGWLGDLGGRLVPRRVGRVLGYAIGVLGLFLFATGLVVDVLVGVANSAFGVQNGVVDPDVQQPEGPLRSGSAASLIPWETLGQPGRNWVVRGPTADDIDAFGPGGAIEPIRAYVGIDSAGSVEERAELLLEELIRMGAFQREVLVLATSTGSGGIDPLGTSTVEYMHNGDTAIAGVQYSFLPSWISYFVDQSAAKEAAAVTFETIHDHWRDLDRSERPAFYLFGVSLGSYGSEASARSLRASGDPIDGAVWAGPTFNNDEWRAITRGRDGDSPAWLPVFDGGAVVRFTSRENRLGLPGGDWQRNRFVYIQHGSDPVTFFSPDLLLHEPDWLRGSRAPDVTEHMNWYPFVTFWQVLLDLPAGGSVPRGFGHNFGSRAYIDAWVGVTEPAGWTDADSDRLERMLIDDG